mmetsp:Transcript_27484/g.41600  ORF Transcript_27484/g.41600 Transcript_27484/m.41600 type:complete len:171 (-) Transcript_27484:136-648(-)|eukprot:CAMPEP_0178922364 /NCGR_PEP_ID=MMETSP0786-20121207/16109_1 /TAXON_ID=186022 /ORGANISM="Thalassionema frauenfeldii, Strain CCMP 1798" /LENGTH=170 /DNA_ID=CAMNT_0020596713 /DNA_START=270 /DNA_END=782 /DNA_ORIENTATION=+
MLLAFIPSPSISSVAALANKVPSSTASILPRIELSTPLLIAEDIPSVTTFDPVLPDTTTLVGFGVLTILCGVAWVIWSDQVVPVSRTKLAISKSRGDVKEYLDDLKQGGDERPVEQWLFADWLQDNKSAKQPAIPFLKKAKWNSGDNPVVVTSAIMILGIVVASISERVI